MPAVLHCVGFVPALRPTWRRSKRIPHRRVSLESAYVLSYPLRIDACRVFQGLSRKSANAEMYDASCTCRAESRGFDLSDPSENRGLGRPRTSVCRGDPLGDLPPRLIETSISAYYYTGMRTLFTGSLCAIATFMLCTRGYDRKDALADIFSGICAIGVAFFPTAPAGGASDHQRHVGWVHYSFAALLFLTLTYFCLFLFTMSAQGRGHHLEEASAKPRLHFLRRRDLSVPGSAPHFHSCLEQAVRRNRVRNDISLCLWCCVARQGRDDPEGLAPERRLFPLRAYVKMWLQTVDFPAIWRIATDSRRLSLLTPRSEAKRPI